MERSVKPATKPKRDYYTITSLYSVYRRQSRFLRIAYTVQFLFTLVATFDVWAQVGGQGHLDLMPWYWKLILPSALSLATVRATAAAVHRDRLGNRRTSVWLSAALILAIVMGLLTYYEHLHEPPDEGDESPAQINKI
jgi:4-amino-4-deoxy-L-arabinose transferase-like glycosyltransferase